MQTVWDYAIIEVYVNMPREGIQEILNNQGQDGWEHYAIRQHPNTDPNVDVPLIYYYFKRPHQ